MKSGVMRRLFSLVLNLFIATVLSFWILHLSPIDPVTLHMEQLGLSPSPEVVAELRHKYALDEPVPVQYWIWLKGVLQGDLGYSIIFHTPVSTLLAQAIPLTVQLSASALVVSILITLPLGLLAFFYRSRWVDALIRFLTFGAIAIPTFWLSLLLIFIFAVKLSYLPVIATGAQGLILPTAALSVWISGLYIRRLRTALLEEYQKDYIAGARALGLGKWKILFCYLMPNALPGLISMMGLTVGGLLGGSVVIESIFGWRGMGALMVEAVTQHDYHLMQGYVLWGASMFILANLCADILCYLLDPRQHGKAGDSL
ncbi:ABC transporter permease [Selenomonas sp. TAMA-11512]|uniref:ABC transporter permease n=1 Tax=Selenomonas sp. TAMA-11512 TaxID=3095337 RepID=UPI0030886FAF|nr:ABC transporter permease [Selenomonas sp. TAMA-11512]